MEVSRCPACGAPLPTHVVECAYCLSYIRQDTKQAEESKPKPQPQPKTEPELRKTERVKDVSTSITFHRVEEPNEQAFIVAVPQGWDVTGGIFRADLTH